VQLVVSYAANLLSDGEARGIYAWPCLRGLAATVAPPRFTFNSAGTAIGRNRNEGNIPPRRCVACHQAGA